MILIVSQYKFPDGDAGSVRYYGFARTIKDCLHQDVRVIGYGDVTDDWKDYKGIPYLSLRGQNKLRSYLQFSSNLISEIKRCNDVSSIIVGNVDNYSLIRLKRYCRKNRIRLIDDVVEWYAAEQFSKGKWDYRYIMKNLENTRIIDSSMSVIAISTYLHSYFSSKGISSAYIPNYMVQSEYEDYEKQPSDKLFISYAGAPGKKDSLNMMLEGLSMLEDNERERIVFMIMGATGEQVKESLGNDAIFSKIECSIVTCGRVPRLVVLDNLKKSDFTVLLRSETARNTKAGFPTKVIESISTGTPVIMNYTSDLKMYFHDGVDCIQVKEYSAESFSKALRRALALTADKRVAMSQRAKILAVQLFNVSSYSEAMRTILGL